MPFISRNKFKQIQATQSNMEGQLRQILNMPSFQDMVSGNEFSNRYTSYASQIHHIYQACQAKTPYGSPLISDIVEKRTNLILSDGLNIDCENPQVYDWIDNWLKQNNLYGSNIIKLIKIGEKEGRILGLLIPSASYVQLKLKHYYYTKYNININEDDEDKLDSITFNLHNGEKIYQPEYFAYIHNADRFDVDPQSCITSILTQCDNIDRALYDLRKNNHLFGFSQPAIEVQNSADIVSIKKAISEKKIDIGDVFVGTGKKYFPTPPDSSVSVREEIALNTKIISSKTGIPPHWIGWVDLMSNRATALEMRDQIILSTRDEKMIICEFLKDAIKKSMTLSVDNGFEDAVYDDEFEITIPDISIETIKQLSETWLPLQQADVISMQDLRNKIPSIDEKITAEQVKNEKDENMVNFQKNIGTLQTESKNGSQER